VVVSPENSPDNMPHGCCSPCENAGEHLLTPTVFDMASFAGLARPLRNAVAAARHCGAVDVPRFGATYGKPDRRKAVAGRR